MGQKMMISIRKCIGFYCSVSFIRRVWRYYWTYVLWVIHDERQFHRGQLL